MHGCAAIVLIGEDALASVIGAIRVAEPSAADYLPLSDREVQVLQLVAEGLGNDEIGARLSLSGTTVKSHLSRIGRKLGLRDRAGLVFLALRYGIIR